MESTGNGRKFSADADTLNGNLSQSAAVGKSWKCRRQQSANAGNYNQDLSKCRQQTAMTGNSVDNPNCLSESGVSEEHLQPLYRSLLAELSAEERWRAEQLIRENETLFSKSAFDIGRTELVQHRIDTGAVSYTHLTLPTIYSV